MKKVGNWAFLTAIFVASFFLLRAFADGTAPAVPAVPGFLDTILGWLASAMGVSATIAVVLELLFRLVPTKAPLSWAHLIGAVAKKVGAIMVALGDLLDKVLPQNLA